MNQDLVTPPHVKPEQIVDFDIFAEASLQDNPHRGYRALHATAPDIFYTPRNGGHWVVTRFAQMAQILRDPQHFSSRELTIPKSNSDNVMLPLNLDPPEHTPYRAVLMRHFDRKVIAAMEPTLRAWAARLIEPVAPAGRCDFSENLGAAFPVSIFMELLGVPLERFEELRAIVKEYFSRTTNARYIELQNTMIAIFTELAEERRRAPKDDLISKLLAETVNGRPLTLQELQSIGFLLFLGGLDTVANALTFAFHNLAQRPDVQARLVAEPEKIPDFVEESLRCFGIVHQTRIVKQDIEIAGVQFREGDMVSCALPLAGLDDRCNPDPDRFDIDRQNREHIVFSTGAHLCIGAALARAEMRVFTEEWLKRIPVFALAPGVKLDWRAGQVMALMNLPLQWPT
ncbi:MAG: cytochrome P450 [Hydrogenophilaceae bacterium]|jgi:cytochrome P450|nr:cytochrome P450 [Hydrogenophilaceae bacterium]